MMPPSNWKAPSGFYKLKQIPYGSSEFSIYSLIIAMANLTLCLYQQIHTFTQ